MKERTKEWLALISVVGMFVFVGIAVQLNIHDSLTGSHYADIVNLIGWCLIPIIGIPSLWYLRKILKKLVVR